MHLCIPWGSPYAWITVHQRWRPERKGFASGSGRESVVKTWRREGSCERISRMRVTSSFPISTLPAVRPHD